MCQILVNTKIEKVLEPKQLNFVVLVETYYGYDKIHKIFTFNFGPKCLWIDQLCFGLSKVIIYFYVGRQYFNIDIFFNDVLRIVKTPFTNVKLLECKLCSK